MRLPGLSNVHLSYCLNVHPGRTLAEAEAAVFERARRVFGRAGRRIAISPPFGLGMWFLGRGGPRAGRARAARRLRGETDQGALRLHFNGFPYGRFHGTRVKEKVYLPDWSDDARSDYTDRLAGFLAQLLPNGVNGTISTLPVTFRSWATDEKIALAVRRLADAAALPRRLRDDWGHGIVLALEPGARLLPRNGRRRHPLLRGPAPAPRPASGLAEARLHERGGGRGPPQTPRRLPGHDALRRDVRGSRRGGRPSSITRDSDWEGPLGAASASRSVPRPPRETRGPSRTRSTCTKSRSEPATASGASSICPRRWRRGYLAGEWRVHFHVPLAWPGEGPIGATSGQVTRDFLAALWSRRRRALRVRDSHPRRFPALRGSAKSVLAQDIAWIPGRLR